MADRESRSGGRQQAQGRGNGNRGGKSAQKPKDQQPSTLPTVAPQRRADLKKLPGGLYAVASICGVVTRDVLKFEDDDSRPAKTVASIETTLVGNDGQDVRVFHSAVAYGDDYDAGGFDRLSNLQKDDVVTIAGGLYYHQLEDGSWPHEIVVTTVEDVIIAEAGEQIADSATAELLGVVNMAWGGRATDGKMANFRASVLTRDDGSEELQRHDVIAFGDEADRVLDSLGDDAVGAVVRIEAGLLRRRKRSDDRYGPCIEVTVETKIEKTGEIPVYEGRPKGASSGQRRGGRPGR